MKGTLKTLSILAAMMTPQFLRGYKTNPETKEEIPVKARFVPGD
jgi:hypothetical protein